MAMHTYIGARYVPRFVGAYDATQSYEAMDVVDNGSGTSYIAKVPTPAGTPLTDTDYWFMYGASSGAIVALQNDMITAQNDILTLQGDVTSLDNRVDYLEGQNRRVITISDSYGEYPSVAGSWQSLLEAKYSTADFYNYHMGSMGIAHVAGGYNALTLLQANEVNIPDHNTITDIIFGLGINDYLETINDVKTAYDALITHCQTEYPKARIWFAFISFNDGLSRPQIAIYKQLISVMQSKANEYGCIFCGNIEYVMHNRKLRVDNVHPNADGASELCNAISCYLEGRTFNANYSLETLARFTGGVDGSIIFAITNNIATIGIATEIATASSLSFSGRSPLLIGTCDDALFRNSRENALVPNYTSDAGAPSVLGFLNNGTNLYLISSVPGSHSQSNTSLNNCFAMFNTLDM